MNDTVKILTQDSGDQELYTPYAVTLAAMKTMGGIDLDPASCAEANHVVHADTFYTKADDGLTQPWYGRVWLNHPFSNGWKACDDKCTRKTCEKIGHRYYDIPSNHDWISKLLNEHTFGDIEQSCNICFAATSEKWCQPLLEFPHVNLYPRTNYTKPGGTKTKQVLKGSMVTYIGPHVDRFYQNFKHLGTVLVPYTKRRMKTK